MLRLAHPWSNTSCIVITNDSSSIETKNVNDVDMRIMTMQEFFNKYKNDNKFKRDIARKLTKVLCDFRVFKASKCTEKLLGQNVAMFPIDKSKVPFSVREEVSDYPGYIHLLLNSALTIARPGN
jgi:hypothetical protein